MEEEKEVRFDNVKKEEIKTAVAITRLDVFADCPYCKREIEVTDECKQHLDDDLSAKDIEIDCTCYNCNKDFIVTKINY